MMDFILNILFTDMTVILITLTFGFFVYFQWAYSYWKRKNVPYIQPRFPFGTMDNPFTRQEHPALRIKRYYDTLKSQGHKHGGMYIFTRPLYLAVDPEYIKNIMSKDFQHFTDRGVYYNERDDPLSGHLFNIEGQKWKNLRTKLTPTFTSGKMKMMFQTLVACSDQLIEAMDELHEKNKAVDIKDLLGCFSTDIIGSCAFGIDCNSFKNPDGDFRKYGRKIFAPFTKLQTIKNSIAFANNNLGRFLRIILLAPEVIDFFLGVVKDTVEYREKTNYTRKDFMQILIDLKNNKTDYEDKNGEGLTLEQLAAHAFVFFFAGFEASSTTMSFCLYELALNPEIQQRARDEVNSMLEQNREKITYDSVMELKYLSQVVDGTIKFPETLRKYPPVTIFPRKCVRDYKIPGTDVVIDKETIALIPAWALHHDAEYFPNPEMFDPGRFSEDNKNKIVPYTYIPFGEGPRICIGARFGLMQTKVGLAALLKNYKFSVNNKTDVPLVIDPFNFFLSTKEGIWLDIKKVDT